MWHTSAQDCRWHEKRLHGTPDKDCQHNSSQPGEGSSSHTDQHPDRRCVQWGKHADVKMNSSQLTCDVVFVFGCRAVRGLQGALGDLCRPDSVRDQQEEHYRLGNHECILIKKWMEFKVLKSFLCGLQIGSGHPRPCSEDDMESPFPKELTLQQVRQHALTSTGLYSRRRQRH